MAVPKFELFIPEVFDSLSDGLEHVTKDIHSTCYKKMKLSDAQLAEYLPSGTQAAAYNRVQWAITYLCKAGLIEKVQRGVYRLTDEGMTVSQNGETANMDLLKRYPSFIEFQQGKTVNIQPVSSQSNGEEDSSPIELVANVIEQMKASIIDELKAEVMKIEWWEFEQLVNQLLLKMGYGSIEHNENPTTKKTGDGGIDGVIKADRFGFDSIYVQAKQWEKKNSVSTPEIQKFAGALLGCGATKGIFITTSSFSSGAQEYAKNNTSPKIKLIDGDALCKLMFEYNLGVTVSETYQIKKIDYDFFGEQG